MFTPGEKLEEEDDAAFTDKPVEDAFSPAKTVGVNGAVVGFAFSQIRSQGTKHLLRLRSPRAAPPDLTPPHLTSSNSLHLTSPPLISTRLPSPQPTSRGQTRCSTVIG
jgi:hypothetical protein